MLAGLKQMYMYRAGSSGLDESSMRCAYLGTHDVKDIPGGGDQLGGWEERLVLHEVIRSLCKHGLVPAGVALYAVQQVSPLLAWVELHHSSSWCKSIPWP